MIDRRNHYARYCKLVSLAASSAPARQWDGGCMAAVYILSADKTLCDIARRKICPDGISFPGILSAARRTELSNSQFTAICSARNLFNGGSSSPVTPYDLVLYDYLVLDIITQAMYIWKCGCTIPADQDGSIQFDRTSEYQRRGIEQALFQHSSEFEQTCALFHAIMQQDRRHPMDNTQQIFPALRLVAQFADGQRLTFDGLTEQQARQSMEAAQAQHGGITWFNGVTDQYYENGRYYKFTPQPPEITMIDLTGYNEPQEEERPMPVPEYRRRGNDRYSTKCDYISVHPIKSIGVAIRATAKVADQSVQGYVTQVCVERVKREGQPLEFNTPDEPPEP